MRYISLFSGIEAASVAWEALGWEPVAFSEIDPFPCAVLEHRYPDVPNLGDITQIDWKEVKDKYGAVDLVVGGSPCQSFSIAGGREGLDGESRLMYEYIRAVHDLRPAWFLWENVPGVFSTDAGRAFGILLDEMEKLGYGLAWRVLDAQFFGVAQRRRRVFLVGHLGDMRAAAVLFDADSVSGNTKPSREKRQELAGAVEGRAGGSFALNRQIIPSGSTAQGPVETFECSPTLDASTSVHGVMAFDPTQVTSPVNRSTPEPEVCHTMPAQAVPPTICIQGAGETSLNSNGAGYSEDGTCYTLNTLDRHAVFCAANTTAGASIDDDMCGALLAEGGCLASNGEDFVGALCARDCKGIGSQDIGEGKVICHRLLK